MPTNRRRFLREGTLAFAGVTAGAVTILTGCGSSDVAKGFRTVGFGWSVNGLNGSSAYAYFRVASEVALETLSIDGSFEPSVAAPTTSFEQVLCQAWVSRGTVPTFGNVGGTSAPHASGDFGAIIIYNPNNLVVASDRAPLQDVFYSVVLQPWVPIDRVDSVTSRAVSGRPSLMLHSGDYLVFSIDHTGAPGDLEMQVVLGYL